MWVAKSETLRFNKRRKRNDIVSTGFVIPTENSTGYYCGTRRLVRGVLVRPSILGLLPFPQNAELCFSAISPCVSLRLSQRRLNRSEGGHQTKRRVCSRRIFQMESTNRNGVVASTQGGRLQDGISRHLSQWNGLQMAVQNQWGGRDSHQKSLQLAADIFSWFSESKGCLHYSFMSFCIHLAWSF